MILLWGLPGDRPLAAVAWRLRQIGAPAFVLDHANHRVADAIALGHLGLVFAGIDLRRATDGDWYCFEVNPSPRFSYYQQSTGQLIDLAVARYLAGGTDRARALRRRRGQAVAVC